MRAGRLILSALLVAAAFAGGYWYARRSPSAPATDPKSGRKILYWHDPMHPSYRSDKPGIAPDCGMQLEPVYADEDPGAQKQERPIAYYHDPQDPSYRSDKPGLNPETGNDLVPVYQEPVPGTVTVSAEKQQLIGVTYGVVQPATSEVAIHAVGRVAYDETRISRVNAKIDGWVEQVFVDYTGAPVRKGQPLLTVYSPELLATQQEYLLALKSRNILAGSTVPGIEHRSDTLIEAARRRMELFDMTAAQIEEVARTGKAQRDVMLYSPVSGTVTEKKVFPKQRITPEMELYTIADLSRVWVIADVFESDAMSIRAGMTGIVTIPGTGQRMNARVQQILPEVNPATRTLKVRLDLPNPREALRPDMFVEVDFRFSRSARLSVPASAVLDTGARKTVFVDLGGGVLEPRQVQTGARIGDRIGIVSGLKAGERIVTSGNFLLDSESQMKAAAARSSEPGATAPPPAAGGHQH